MASCAYPSSVVRSNLWAFTKTQNATATYKGWPSDKHHNRSIDRREDELHKEVLDFAKLESDILKNVLGEEEKRLEKKKEESNDIFPSFNYIPPPIPHSFLKSNPILKLYPREMLTAMNFNNKQLESSGKHLLTNNTLTCRNKSSNERHRFNYPNPLPQIPEVQNSPTGNSSSDILTLTPRSSHQLNTKLPTTTSGLSLGDGSYAAVSSSNMTSQYLSATPSITSSDSSRLQQSLQQYPLATSDTTTTSDTCSGSKAETPALQTRSLIPPCVKTEKKRVKDASRTNPICRNFPTVDKSKSRKNRDENVKTFAQIVAAAARPAPTASEHKMNCYRCHE